MFDLRSYKRTSAKLSAYLPWGALVDEGVVLNKDGAFQRTLGFRGPDLESATDGELVGASSRLNNALRRFGAGWCLHIEARRAPVGAYPEASWPDPLSWLIDEERRAMFNAAGARFESRYYLTLAWLCPPERNAVLERYLFEGGEGAEDVDYRSALAYFREESERFFALFAPLMAEARWLSDAQTLSYLHDCISERPHAVRAPETPFFLDHLLADTPLVGGLAPRLGALELKVISVRAFVSETEPGLLDALNRLPLGYRWVTRFMPLEREGARREIEKIRKRWFSKRKGLMTLLREALFREEAQLLDNDAANQASDADLALQQLGDEAISAGFVTITITIAEPSAKAAEEAVREVQQVADGLGFVTQVETVNAVEAWLGSLPGQAYADVRRPILLSPNLTHLLPACAVWAGPDRNAHFNAAPLMLAATDGATPFRLDLHAGDVGHTLVIGPTGAGKSVLLAALSSQWRRYRDAQIYLFDKGRSARATVLGLGGDFFDLDEAADLAFQPLERIDEPSERAWAFEWTLSLLRSSGVEADPEQRGEIWRVLELLGARPKQERTLSVFAALVQDSILRNALEAFTHDGAYGTLVDAELTSLGYGSVQAFELGDLLRKPAAAAAVLGVLFHALERRFDGRPTLLVLDEAWLFLKHAYFAAQIQDWLKTLRKRNVAVVFASQEIADVEASDIASTIIEACATRIFLANDRAREPRSGAFYRALGLNARQIATIANATPKQDYYLVCPSGARLFDLELGPAALAFFGASRPEDHAHIDAMGNAGEGGLFAERWLRARGMEEAAAALARFAAHQRAPRTSIVPELKEAV